MGADPVPSDTERHTRAVAALIPFVQAGWMSLNPEDLDEIAHAVLTHADGTASYEQINEAVTAQITDAEQRARHMYQAMRDHLNDQQ